MDTRKSLTAVRREMGGWMEEGEGNSQGACVHIPWAQTQCGDGLGEGRAGGGVLCNSVNNKEYE